MNIFTALFITGIILLFLDKKLETPEPEIKYVHIPLNLDDHMKNASKNTDKVMNDMINDENVWNTANKII